MTQQGLTQSGLRTPDAVNAQINSQAIEATLSAAEIIQRRRAIRVVNGAIWFTNHWLTLFSIGFGALMIAPFLAPVFLSLGWNEPARAIYSFYSVLCHQMAQRSFFLFGQGHPIAMYNLNALPVASNGGTVASEIVDMDALRAFVGNATLGWKVAWSDRMVYMYIATWVGGIAYALLPRRKEVRPLGIIGFGLFLLPMAIDGFTHFLSDMQGGLAGGWRYTNEWLAQLTAHALPQWFYVGDAFGSFNALIRLISGICFGIGVVWFMFPRLDQSMRDTRDQLRAKLIAAGVLQA